MPCCRSFRGRIWLCALLSVVVVVILTLLLPAGLYLSSPQWDLGEFVALRGFAADRIHAGDFPLWNPYIYSGEPFLGDFQSAELYPLNAIFLIMPLARAINLSFLLHLLILGWGVGFWAARRGYHPVAALLAGMAASLGGPMFLRLANGQLGYVTAAAWAPWILCGLEAAWRGPARKPLLLTSAAIALQILGGHPQYVFFVAIAAGLHAIVQSVLDPAVRRRALPMVAVVYLAGATLAAMQLLPGMAATAESVRQGRLDFEFVSLSSFPPENLLTLIAPQFFGDFSPTGYWGRYFFWEMCLFVSVSGVILALLALGDRKHRRTARADWFLMGLLFLLALGIHTPLLRIMYDYFPYYDRFRSPSKFNFPAMLFGVMALAAGADAVIHGRIGRKFFAVGLMAASLAAIAPGIYLLLHPTMLSWLLNFVQQSRESRVSYPIFSEPEFVHAAGMKAGQSLLVGGLLLALVGASLLLAHHRPRWRYAPLVLLPIELIGFVQANLVVTRLDLFISPAMKKFLGDRPGDYRILYANGLNQGYLLGVPDLWGDNPTVLKRYAEYQAFTQNADPDHANQITVFNTLPLSFNLLRLRFAFFVEQPGVQIYEYSNVLPHVMLISHYQVLSSRDAIFAEIAKLNFNPTQTVFLESRPNPCPQPDAPPGTAQLVSSTSDSLTIEADTPAPAILLITDVYSRDWYARPLAGSVQTHYDVMPGDYILRAIPLAAGHHHLVVEYDPPSFRQGLIVSGLAWLGWVGCLLVPAWIGRKKRAALTAPPAAPGAECSPCSG